MEVDLLPHRLHMNSSSVREYSEIPKNADPETKKEAFIQIATLIHGDKYDYSCVEYVNSQTRVLIGCRKSHGFFMMTPNCHISQEQGCPECGKYAKLQTFRK